MIHYIDILFYVFHHSKQEKILIKNSSEVHINMNVIRSRFSPLWNLSSCCEILLIEDAKSNIILYIKDFMSNVKQRIEETANGLNKKI